MELSGVMMWVSIAYDDDDDDDDDGVDEDGDDDDDDGDDGVDDEDGDSDDDDDDDGGDYYSCNSFYLFANIISMLLTSTCHFTLCSYLSFFCHLPIRCCSLAFHQ